MSRYERAKENARQKAMDWQTDYCNNNYSYGISIHTPHTGVNAYKYHQKGGFYAISIHTPHTGVNAYKYHQKGGFYAISIHTPTRG